MGLGPIAVGAKVRALETQSQLTKWPSPCCQLGYLWRGHAAGELPRTTRVCKLP